MSVTADQSVEHTDRNLVCFSDIQYCHVSYSTSVIGLRKPGIVLTGSGVPDCDVTPSHDEPLTRY